MKSFQAKYFSARKLHFRIEKSHSNVLKVPWFENSWKFTTQHWPSHLQVLEFGLFPIFSLEMNFEQSTDWKFLPWTYNHCTSISHIEMKYFSRVSIIEIPYFQCLKNRSFAYKLDLTLCLSYLKMEFLIFTFFHFNKTADIAWW